MGGEGTTEVEMVGWHHRLDGHEFDEAPGVSDGQGGLACCSPWGRIESDMTDQLNSTEPYYKVIALFSRCKENGAWIVLFCITLLCNNLLIPATVCPHYIMSFSSELTLINELGTFPVIQKERRKSLGYGFCLFVCLFYFRDSLVGFILGISFFWGGKLFCLFVYRIFQNYIFAFTWIEIFITLSG